MDSFEWNKVAGWVLAACVAVLGLTIISGDMFAAEKPEKPGYVVEGVEAEGEGAAAPAEAEKPIAFYLASASAEKGAAVFKKCAACHTVNSGGANGIGPNLYGIVGNSHAHSAGFSYSAGLLETKGKSWGFDELNEWLKSPKAYIPGNKMSFAGIGKPEDRAAVLLYLNAQGAKPLPLPPVPAEAPPAAAAEAAPVVAPADAAAAAPAAE